MRIHAVLLLAAVAVSAGGCNILSWPLYVFAPPVPMKTVQAECNELQKSNVAIVVYAGPDTKLDYELVPLEIFDAVSAELKRRVKGITMVDPRRVMRYQQENPRWDSEPPEKLCKVFDCDVILLISLMEFSTREPGSMHLARGRLAAEASVYLPEKTPDGAKGGRVWRSELIRVVYPPKSPLGVAAKDDWRVRVETEKLFAARLVKSFYKHKVPKE